MNTDDVLRELRKALEVLDKAATHLERTSEANAALHLSDRVMYPPLTSAVRTTAEDLRRFLAHHDVAS